MKRVSERVMYHGGISNFTRDVFKLLMSGDLRLFIIKLVAFALDEHVVRFQASAMKVELRPFMPDLLLPPVEATVAREFLSARATEGDPVVSVIIPCFGQAQFVFDALQSVAASTSRIHQCVVVDDGNSSRSQLVFLDQLVPAADHQELVILRQPNQGLSAARNAGLKVAKADKVLFLDADDLLSIGALDLMAKSLEMLDCDVVIGSTFHWSTACNVAEVRRPVTTTDERGMASFFDSVEPLDIVSNWENGLSIPIHSAMFKLKSVPQFDVALKSKEDLAFWINFFSTAKAVSLLDKIVCVYRQHDSQMTKTDPVKNGFYFLEAIRLAFDNDTLLGDNNLRKIIGHVENQYGSESLKLWCGSSVVRKSSPLGVAIEKLGHL